MGKIADKLNTCRAVKWLWIVVAAPFVLLSSLLLLTAIGTFGKLPTFEELENPKSNLATELYSEDGELVGSYFVQNRSFVDYSELNDSIVAALVATEDKRFYSHSGIDMLSLARVGIKTVTLGNRDAGGGSTITQQLAKNLFPRDTAYSSSKIVRRSKLVIAKFKEWITALKLEYNYTKPEIIAMYLNTVAYGSNAYGIRAAAHTFFNKEPHELNIPEAAMLVGVVNAPTRYSPVRNPKNALARRNVVLDRMRTEGYLTRKQYDSIAALPIVLDYHPVSHNEGKATYFREMVRSVMTAKRPQRSHYTNEWDYRMELERWENNPLYGWCVKNLKADGTPYNIYRDGLKIYTTINSSMQRYAEEAVEKNLADDIQPRMDRQVRQTGQTFHGISKDLQARIMRNAVRYSDRYRNMKNAGASDAEIEKSFDTPVRTRILTYKSGEVDTLITPRDSIIHHKRMLRASFMAVDPLTGYVKAYVGGPDFKYFKYDMVRQGKRHIGSTVKPFVYTFAIDNLGLTPCTLVPNVPVAIETPNGEVWEPKEASGTKAYDGELKPLKWGLANSRNNYSAWIMKQSKQPAVVADFIHRMGIVSYIDPVYPLCLGTMDVSLFEMVGAYSTFVNKGVHTEPIFVTRIEDRYGNVLASFSPSSSDVINEATAYTMLGMLQNVVNAGTAGRLRWMYGFTGQMGGKTGTSQENRDAWFMGVTPNLVAGAWVGGEDQSVYLLRGGEGAALALPIYAAFMKKVYADPGLGVLQTDEFPKPANAVEYDCESEYERYNDGSRSDVDEFFD